MSEEKFSHHDILDPQLRSDYILRHQHQEKSRERLEAKAAELHDSRARFHDLILKYSQERRDDRKTIERLERRCKELTDRDGALQRHILQGRRASSSFAERRDEIQEQTPITRNLDDELRSSLDSSGDYSPKLHVQEDTESPHDSPDSDNACIEQRSVHGLHLPEGQAEDTAKSQKSQAIIEETEISDLKDIILKLQEEIKTLARTQGLVEVSVKSLRKEVKTALVLAAQGF